LHIRRASLASSFGRVFEGVIQIEAKYLLYPSHERLKSNIGMLELSNFSFPNIFFTPNIGIDPELKVRRAALGK
jgi:hypothetical protein